MPSRPARSRPASSCAVSVNDRRGRASSTIGSRLLDTEARVDGREHRTEPRQRTEHRQRVQRGLAPPGDAIAGAHALRGEHVREAVRRRVELAEGHRRVADGRGEGARVDPGRVLDDRPDEEGHRATLPPTVTRAPPTSVVLAHRADRRTPRRPPPVPRSARSDGPDARETVVPPHQNRSDGRERRETVLQAHQNRDSGVPGFRQAGRWGGR